MNITGMSVVDFNTKLYEDFPTYFTEQFWGVECSSGWFLILYDLCQKFSAMDLPKNFQILQIKEKFGTLRVYTSASSPEIDDAIRHAEGLTHTTCEVCGSSDAGGSSINGWMRTLCGPCHKNMVTSRKSENEIWTKA